VHLPLLLLLAIPKCVLGNHKLQATLLVQCSRVVCQAVMLSLQLSLMALLGLWTCRRSSCWKTCRTSWAAQWMSSCNVTCCSNRAATLLQPWGREMQAEQPRATCQLQCHLQHHQVLLQ
jgi:hypothetical protein